MLTAGLTHLPWELDLPVLRGHNAHLPSIAGDVAFRRTTAISVTSPQLPVPPHPSPCSPQAVGAAWVGSP